MTLQWITTPSVCQKLRFSSTKSMLGILVRRTSIPLKYLQLERRASPHAFRRNLSAAAQDSYQRILRGEKEWHG